MDKSFNTNFINYCRPLMKITSFIFQKFIIKHQNNDLKLQRYILLYKYSVFMYILGHLGLDR